MDNIHLAVAYYTNGANFRASAERLADGLELDATGRPTRLTAVPLYFLASHAAELFLKAALLKRGYADELLREYDYRHNLTALLSEVQAKGVAVTPETVEVITGLSEQHRRHQLRYTLLIDGARTYFPPLMLVFSALDELLMLTRLSTHGL